MTAFESLPQIFAICNFLVVLICSGIRSLVLCIGRFFLFVWSVDVFVACFEGGGWVSVMKKRGANSQKLLSSCSFNDLTQHLSFCFFKWHFSSFCLLMQQMCQLPPLNNMLTLLKSWLWLCANVQSANKVWTQWDKYLQSNNFQFLTNTNVTLTSDPCEK